MPEKVEVKIRGTFKDDVSKPVDKATDKAGGSFNSLKKVAAMAGIAVAAAFAFKAITAGLSKLKEMISDTIFGVAELGDQMAKMSKRTGFAVEKLTALKYAAELSDVGVSTLARALGNLVARMRDVQEGLKTSERAFDELGIKVMNADGSLRKAEDVFYEVADAIAGMTNETDRLSLAQEVLGVKAGINLLPLLMEGSKGIRKMEKDAKALGITFSGEAAQAAEIFNDRMHDLKEWLKGLRNTIGFELLPQINTIIERVVEWAKKNNALINEELKEWARRVGELIAKIVDKLLEWVGKKGSVEGAIESAATALKRMLDIVEALVRNLELIMQMLTGMALMAPGIGTWLGQQIISSQPPSGQPGGSAQGMTTFNFDGGIHVSINAGAGGALPSEQDTRRWVRGTIIPELQLAMDRGRL